MRCGEELYSTNKKQRPCSRKNHTVTLNHLSISLNYIVLYWYSELCDTFVTSCHALDNYEKVYMPK